MFLSRYLYGAMFAVTMLSAQTAEAAPLSPSLMATFNQACTAMANMSVFKNFGEQINDLCEHGQVSARTLKALAKPYAGLGDTANFVEPKISSEDGETTILALFALHFPLSSSEFMTAHEHLGGFKVEEGRLKMDLQPLGPAAIKDPGAKDCIRIHQTMSATIALIDFDTSMVQKNCTLTLSEHPAINIIYIELDPSAKNPDNRLMNHFTVSVEDAGSTYNVTSMHAVSDNRHFPAIAEGVAEESLPFLNKAFYNRVMQASGKAPTVH